MNEQKLKILLTLLEEIPRYEWERLKVEVDNQYSHQADKVGLASDSCKAIKNNYGRYGFYEG